MSENVNVIKRGLQSTIDNHAIDDGKIYFSTDTNRLFMDIANERLEYTDFVRGLKYAEVIALESPLPKVYLTTDTRQLLAYDFTKEQWVAYSGGDLNPTNFVTDMYYNIDNNIVLVYGDGHTKVVSNNPITEKLDEIQSTLDRYERVIEIIEQEYGLNE